MKIINGNFEVLHSGIVVSVPNKPIDFILDRNLKVRLLFDNPGYSHSGHSVEAELLGEDLLVLHFMNYRGARGGGNVEPLYIGVYAGKNLFLNYRIYEGNVPPMRSKKEGVTVMYTWLLENVKR